MLLYRPNRPQNDQIGNFFRLLQHFNEVRNSIYEYFFVILQTNYSLFRRGTLFIKQKSKKIQELK